VADWLFELGFDDPRKADLERRVGLVVEAVRKQPGWPVDDGLDRRLALDLIELYPTADLPAMIASWRMWMAEKKQRATRLGVRKRVMEWCRRERDWRAGASRRSLGAGVRRTGPTTPRTGDDFADDGGDARPW
jgi:hypothetical protein